MTSRRRIGIAATGFAAAFAFASTPVRTDDPVSSSVRFTGEIVRIFARKCQPCHADDGLAMPLDHYREVRAWGRAIREEIVEQRMPPWPAARGYGRFRNDLSLSSRETLTLLSWLDGGMPRGEDKDLPAAAAAAERKPPDLRIALPPQRIPALEEHVVRRVSIPASEIDASRAIARISVAPATMRAMRGALVYAGERGADAPWIGAWLPWQRDAAPPEGHAFRLPATTLTVELHYRGGERELTDASHLEVWYAAAGTRAIDQLTVGSGDPARLQNTAAIWAIVPSAGTAASLQLSARRPDGSSEVLLWMPRMQHDWPQALVLDTPLRLPAGTTVSLIAHPADGSARARLSLLP